jgi:hypothetical protein
MNKRKRKKQLKLKRLKFDIFIHNEMCKATEHHEKYFHKLLIDGVDLTVGTMEIDEK